MKRILLVAILTVASLRASTPFNVFDLRPLPNTPLYQIPDSNSCQTYWNGFHDALDTANQVLNGGVTPAISFTTMAYNSRAMARQFLGTPGYFYFMGRYDAFMAVATAVGENPGDPAPPIVPFVPPTA